MIGLPTSGGFVSKLYLSVGALGAGQPLVVAVILFSTVLTGFYFFPIITVLLFGQANGVRIEKKPWSMMEVAVGLLLILSVLSGVAPDVFAGLLELGVRAIM